MSYLDGQFLPRQPIQFVGGQIGPRKALSVADITITDHGDFGSTTGSATPSTGSVPASSGPDSVAFITWETSNDGVTLNSATWNGNAVTILHQEHTNLGATEVGAAICIISGAQSGTFAATFSDTLSTWGVTSASLGNLSSHTAVDTDQNTGSGTDISLTGLASPGTGGIRLVAFANVTQSSSTVTWTGATEIADSTPGLNYRHSVAYDIGASGATITADSAANTQVIVGVSLR